MHTLFCLQRKWLRRCIINYRPYFKGYGLCFLAFLYGLVLYDMDPYHFTCSLPVPRWQCCVSYSSFFLLSYWFIYQLQPAIGRYFWPKRPIGWQLKTLRVLQLWLQVSLAICLYKFYWHAIPGSFMYEWIMTSRRTLIFGLPIFLLSMLLLRYVQQLVGSLQESYTQVSAPTPAETDLKDALLYIESDGSDKKFYYWINAQTEVHQKRMSMKEVENQFCSRVELIWCSRSCMVNAAMIDVQASYKLRHTIVLRYGAIHIPVKDTWHKPIKCYLKDCMAAEAAKAKSDRSRLFP